MPAVVRSIDIKAPPSAVWRHLATPEALRRWLDPTLDIDLRVGGSYRFSAGEDRISGTVLEIVPEGALVLSWFEEGGDWVHPARLSIALAPTAAGTRVTLSHDGFAGIGKPAWQGTVDAYERGADRHRVLERLRDLVVDDAV
ncbi:MAG TPA: SRPBCC domain-containing protein [Trueperaceae bacterium]|nr:SRPBCC domain-containing protein [Trueperaceae bacterium]